MTPARFLRLRAQENPRLRVAILADARIAAANLGHRQRSGGERSGGQLSSLWLVLRMLWEADAFAALLLIRLSIKLRGLGVPVVPILLRRLAMMLAQVHVGAPVILGPGLYLPHGQVVIDGLTVIGKGAVIRPFVTIGLIDGEFVGPTLGEQVSIGTGAKLLGPIRVGDRARIGANAVVLEDIPAGTTAVGMPARVLSGPDDPAQSPPPGASPTKRAETAGRS
ncbi:MAG: hypothetical protein AAF675_21530 [Pseudomonadota bacterium]